MFVVIFHYIEVYSKNSKLFSLVLSQLFVCLVALQKIKNGTY